MSNKRANAKAQRQKNQRLTVLVFVALGGLLLVGAVALLWPKGGGSQSFTPQVSGAPSLKVDKDRIDFGDVKLGTTVEATFTLTNVGDAPLRFTKDPYIQLAAGC